MAPAPCFRRRFFPREEGGTNVRQVWVEVNLLQELTQAAGKECDAALGAVHRLGGEVAGMPFTSDGLEPFVDAPRTQYLIGQVEASCGHADEAAERWRRVAAATGTGDLVWAWGAARKLDGYDNAEWTKRLEAGLARAASGNPYTAAVLETVLGKQKDAWAHYQRAILLPDRMMSHHLTRLAMAGVGLP